MVWVWLPRAHATFFTDAARAAWPRLATPFPLNVSKKVAILLTDELKIGDDLDHPDVNDARVASLLTLSGKTLAELGVQQISDIMVAHSPTSFDRPTYAGNAIVTVEAPAAPAIVATVRLASFTAVGAGGRLRGCLQSNTSLL